MKKTILVTARQQNSSNLPGNKNAGPALAINLACFGGDGVAGGNGTENRPGLDSSVSVSALPKAAD
jgi:hypothetical protein